MQEMIVFLTVFSGFAVYSNFNFSVLWHISTTIIFSIILFYLFSFISKKKKLLSNAIISSLIIFLLIHYFTQNQNIIYDLIISFVTIFYKFFLEYKSIPIINPVVFSSLIVGYISQIFPIGSPLFVSWWGASFNGYLSLILILIWLVYGLRKWRKTAIAISFLAVHLIILLTLRDQGHEIAKFSFFDSTIYFFTAIMLIEPKTSPVKNKDQIIYGILAAIAYNLFFVLNVYYFELATIAVANLYNFWTRRLLIISTSKNT